ncbi:MAG: hypothetical protein Q8Q09_09050 [Deltaproteobacteria bacterium]|nr:hypothetical protein [Deltaproteobacteria bacterium]
MTAQDPVITQAEAHFAQALAALGPLRLPEGVALTTRCCMETNVMGAPVGMAVVLRLRPVVGVEAAPEAPTTQGYRLQLGPNGSVLRSADLQGIQPKLAMIATTGERAIALALARVRGLPRFAEWQRQGWRLTVALMPVSISVAVWSEWHVYVNAMRPQNQGPADSVEVHVDVTRGAVLHTFAGARRELIP